MKIKVPRITLNLQLTHIPPVTIKSAQQFVTMSRYQHMVDQYIVQCIVGHFAAYVIYCGLDLL